MFLKVPETVCSLVEIPVPSQAKLHKQWCLFDQVLFYQAKNKLSQYLHLLSKRATSTLTERCGRSLDPWSRRSRTRTRSLTPFSRGTACLFFNFHFFTDGFIFDCCPIPGEEDEGGLQALTKQRSSRSWLCWMSRSTPSSQQYLYDKIITSSRNLSYQSVQPELSNQRWSLFTPGSWQEDASANISWLCQGLRWWMIQENYWSLCCCW